MPEGRRWSGDAACEDGAMRRLAMLALVLAAVLGGLPGAGGR